MSHDVPFYNKGIHYCDYGTDCEDCGEQFTRNRYWFGVQALYNDNEGCGAYTFYSPSTPITPASLPASLEPGAHYTFCNFPDNALANECGFLVGTDRDTIPNWIIGYTTGLKDIEGDPSLDAKCIFVNVPFDYTGSILLYNENDDSKDIRLTRYQTG